MISIAVTLVLLVLLMSKNVLQKKPPLVGYTLLLSSVSSIYSVCGLSAGSTLSHPHQWNQILTSVITSLVFV